MRYVIGIGSNMGDSVSIVRRAIDEIEATFDVVVDERSSLYRTRPVGGPEQDDYINAVVVMHCDRDPDRVLAGLQEIEHEFGRVRDVRWGPRTLDLDIIAVDDMISVDPALTLPHPRAHERAFVLVPWHEIDPEATLPHHGPSPGSSDGHGGVPRVCCRRRRLLRDRHCDGGRWSRDTGGIASLLGFRPGR
ncbi:MAG: 2-amino-4-hydroxy-6-hydroxymethyldihydropteridine diphosphokinase [Actinobacteria bacterium]|nr:2-amino-4-hydroxy-6-hydroxymethyldihydropteridine diphosphokinase [Actinomycetota bacterium]